MVFPRLQGAAAVVSAALWGFGAPAVAQSVSAKGDTPVRAAAGVVFTYEEKKPSGILYHEEKGGMVTPVAPPVPANVPEPTPAMAADPKSKSAVAPPRKSARKAAT